MSLARFLRSYTTTKNDIEFFPFPGTRHCSFQIRMSELTSLHECVTGSQQHAGLLFKLLNFLAVDMFQHFL
ncbi:hypothetical protein AQUCO_07600021v1 [Aquilegia coerulea]|uniref:Uncharacterized protein n=1 Tax=Aquilegia coerulea TaxID=218851 RepID=A0A2G5C8E6_AQUCA|nr:hypothetical protein AQUCO_07600021v1 [Aquilegia coerulea]